MSAVGAHLAAIARLSPHRKGYTVEFDCDGGLYASPVFDEVAYHTPAYAGLRWMFGVHETPGMVRVFVHPDDVPLAKRALADLAQRCAEADA